MSKLDATTVFEFIEARLNRRSVAFFLCLMLSGLFWLLTSLSKEYVDEIEIPISYNDLPENLLLVNEPTAVVTAEVKGFGFDLLWHWLNFEKINVNVTANPTSLGTVRKAGELMHFVLTSEKTGKLNDLGNDQIEILRIYPDTLFLQFKPLYTRSIPVKLDAEISLMKQYGADGEPVIEPAEIEVSGLKEIVSGIDHILTEKQSWTDLDESVTAEVALINELDTKLVKYSQNTVQVAVNVVKFTEGSVTIPIQVKAGDRSVKVYPSEVEITYQVPLTDYENIQPGMFEAEVVLDAQSEKQSLLTVTLTKSPDRIRQVKLDPLQVEYIVQQ
ncbi:MAG: hypothetical protein H6602_05415 [Flavobacteriales bacterium]|nr:hypothetical protein [Flavobacteriales bacterium]